MSLDGQGVRELSAEPGVPDVELLFQVISLEGQLPRRHIQFGFLWSRAKLGTIKTETASVRFIGDMVEIAVDRTARRLSGSKPFKLRVVPVSPSRSHQDLASEKALPPKGDESL